MSSRLMSHFLAIMSAPRNCEICASPKRSCQPADSAVGVVNPKSLPAIMACEMGIALMFCRPPATTMSWVPLMTPWAAKWMAC